MESVTYHETYEGPNSDDRVAAGKRISNKSPNNRQEIGGSRPDTNEISPRNHAHMILVHQILYHVRQ